MCCISSAGCYFIAEQGEFFMEQNLRKKAIPFIGVAAVLALILFVTFFSDDKLSADFHGTYAAGQVRTAFIFLSIPQKTTVSFMPIRAKMCISGVQYSRYQITNMSLCVIMTKAGRW